MTDDRFAAKAATYEDSPDRVDNVAQIAEAIRSSVSLDPSLHILDFGSGTGLLLERLAPDVGEITAVDVSPSMTAELRAKLDRIEAPVNIHEIDLTAETIEGGFDGIVSSMTMHHIADVASMLSTFRDLVVDGGFIALADLEAEDGTFHTEDTGVHHHGFDPEAFAAEARAAGFRNVTTATVGTVAKEQGRYPIFLLTARR